MDEDKIKNAPDNSDYQSDDTACSAEFSTKGCKNPVSDADNHAACVANANANANADADADADKK